MVTKKIYEKKEKIKKQRNKECKIKEKNERAKGKNETNIMCKEYVRVCMCLCMCMKKKMKKSHMSARKKNNSVTYVYGEPKIVGQYASKKRKEKKIISSHTSVSRIAIARWNYILQLYS